MSTGVDPDRPVLGEKLLTPMDVAALIPGLSPKLLAQWRYERRGPVYYKAGRIVLYPFATLEKWFEGLVQLDDRDDH